MKIDRKELLFGQPILKIRDVLRAAVLERMSFDTKKLMVEDVARILKQPEAIAAEVLNNLIKEGYLIVEQQEYHGEAYVKGSTTEKGRRLAVTKANPPISREKADQLLKELLERVAEINKNKDLVYIVQTIKIFGSYLSDKEELGDIDVAFKLVKRYDGEQYEKKSGERIELAKENGRHFPTIVEFYSWPQREVELLLKTKKKGLSLHNEDADEVIDKTESKLVYTFKK